MSVSDKASDIAKSIWLAGLGAYGKAFDEAQVRYEKATRKTPELFDELVEKGSKLDEQARDAITESRKVSATTIEDRIEKMRQSLSISNLVGSGDKADIASLHKKVDALSDKIDALAALVVSMQAAPAKKSAARKAPAKKAAANPKTKAKTKAKAASKKAPAKKAAKKS